MASNPSSRVNAAVRAQQAHDAFYLKARNMTERQIADQLGISQATVHRRIEEYAQGYVMPEVETWRKLETDQLIADREALMAEAQAGDPKAIMAKLRVTERLHKLWGLDVPVVQKVEHTHIEIDQAQMELAEMIREAEAKEALAQMTQVQTPVDS